MSILQQTNWAYDTSDESNSGYAVFTGGEGHLYLSNAVTSEKLTINYNYASIGTAKGSIWNLAESLPDDPSGSFSNVTVLSGFDFNAGSFPCHGVIFFIGATAGIFQLSFQQHSGADLALVIFGEWPPFAILPIWGYFNSVMPSAGVSVAECQFTV